MDKLETRQQAQQLVGRLAGGQVAAGTPPTQQGATSTPAPTSTAAAGKGPKQQQQQPKRGTLMACWGKAVSVATAVTATVARTLSPAKGNRETESQQSPTTQQHEEEQQPSSEEGQQGSAAQAQQPEQQSGPAEPQQDAGQQQWGGVQQPRGPWDPEGFAWRKLDSKFVAKVFNTTGDARQLLQARMMAREPAGGHVSLDHVHQTAKRMQGGFTGMVIAMSASGTVLGFWNVYSTSLMDIEKQLQDLDRRQRAEHGQVSTQQLA